jgi:hypothetical protein
VERNGLLFVVMDTMTEPKKPKPAKSVKPDTSGKSDKSNARWVAAGAAMGIGSAALVAALLYTNRDKGNDDPVVKHKGPKPESD